MLCIELTCSPFPPPATTTSTQGPDQRKGGLDFWRERRPSSRHSLPPPTTHPLHTHIPNSAAPQQNRSAQRAQSLRGLKSISSLALPSLAAATGRAAAPFVLSSPALCRRRAHPPGMPAPSLSFCCARRSTPNPNKTICIRI